jgi:cytochrome c1
LRLAIWTDANPARWQKPIGKHGRGGVNGRPRMARDVTSAESDLNRAIAEAEELFVQAGQAKIKAEAMDLRRKRVRATLFVKYKADGNPAGASENMAEADPVYELACADWENAALDAETLRAQAEAKRMRFEAWRTANATRRAQMNLR